MSGSLRVASLLLRGFPGDLIASPSSPPLAGGKPWSRYLASHLLPNLIDQQLWLAKGKELGVTGETELVNRLNEIRKQYNLSTMEDLEKAAKEQGVSFEDFKANIRNQIITQQVMRDQVGRKIAPTPGEVQRY